MIICVKRVQSEICSIYMLILTVNRTDIKFFEGKSIF